MKKFFLLAAAALVAFASCSPKEDNTKVKEVVLTPSELSLDEGSAETLEYSIVPETAIYTQLRWTSSDENVAIVNRKGQVTAVNAGHATITLQVDDVEGTCEVTVTKVATPVTGISLSEESITLAIGDTTTIVATIEPRTASDKTVAWTSSDESVATVADGFVTGVGRGNAVITATTNDGGFAAECAVKVENPTVTSTVELSDSQWSKNTYPVFSPDGNTAYIISLTDNKTLRQLIAINLPGAYVDWSYNIIDTETPWSANGGDICVTPSGDIICANQTTVYCISSKGKLVWSYTDTDAAATNTYAAIVGCGPAVSNDGSVIFAGLTKSFCALKASTGELLSSLPMTTGQVQFAVYGTDKIILHDKAGNIDFISFANNTLTIDNTVSSSVGANIDDITSPVITSDQTKAYFFSKAFIEQVDLATGAVVVDNYAEHGKAQHWAGALTPDGKLCSCCVFDGTYANVGVFDTASDLSAENFTNAYKYSGYNSAFNFETPGVGVDGSIYVFVNDSEKKLGDDAHGYFIKVAPNADGEYESSIMATVAGGAKGTFQGCFGYCGNYLLAVSAKGPAYAYICKIDEPRAATWGNGGNPQGNKNANLIE